MFLRSIKSLLSGHRNRVHKRMQTIINDLGYDFQNFTLPSFINHLEQATGRRMYLAKCSLVQQGAFGMWISGDTCELFVVDNKVSEIHQAHILLHEISHFIAGHKTERMTDEEIRVIWKSGCVTPTNAMLHYLMFKEKNFETELQEDEAEATASLIKNIVIQCERLQHLTLVRDSEYNIFLKSFELSE